VGSERKDGPERKFPTDEGSLRIHQAIARQLGTAILTGVHKPGDLFEGRSKRRCGCTYPAPPIARRCAS